MRFESSFDELDLEIQDKFVLDIGLRHAESPDIERRMRMGRKKSRQVGNSIKPNLISQSLFGPFKGT